MQSPHGRACVPHVGKQRGTDNPRTALAAECLAWLTDDYVPMGLVWGGGKTLRGAGAGPGPLGRSALSCKERAWKRGRGLSRQTLDQDRREGP